MTPALSEYGAAHTLNSWSLNTDTSIIALRRFSDASGERIAMGTTSCRQDFPFSATYVDLFFVHTKSFRRMLGELPVDITVFEFR